MPDVTSKSTSWVLTLVCWNQFSKKKGWLMSCKPCWLPHATVRLARWVWSQPWWKLTFCYHGTCDPHQVPRTPAQHFTSRSASSFTLIITRHRKFPFTLVVIVRTMKNVFASLFIFLQRWFLAVPSHSDTELLSVPLWLFSQPPAITTVFVHTLLH